MHEQRIASAKVIPFPVPAGRARRLSARDRIHAASWAVTARQSGFSRVVIHTDLPDDDPELGDFLLIYRDGALWASWAVGCAAHGFTVWRPATGVTVGWFPNLLQALESLPA
ncbi:MAG: hypothetical protein KGJ41_01340 [Rhodospirillales bacterium]|nr:hypothetical protein [Rhodospirillales bacterium]MDE2576528.1 hypothetical protein [Rhodospirillales bacterium]